MRKILIIAVLLVFLFQSLLAQYQSNNYVNKANSIHKIEKSDKNKTKNEYYYLLTGFAGILVGAYIHNKYFNSLYFNKDLSIINETEDSFQSNSDGEYLFKSRIRTKRFTYARNVEITINGKTFPMDYIKQTHDSSEHYTDSYWEYKYTNFDCTPNFDIQYIVNYISGIKPGNIYSDTYEITIERSIAKFNLTGPKNLCPGDSSYVIIKATDQAGCEFSTDEIVFISNDEKSLKVHPTTGKITVEDNPENHSVEIIAKSSNNENLKSIHNVSICPPVDAIYMRPLDESVSTNNWDLDHFIELKNDDVIEIKGGLISFLIQNDEPYIFEHKQSEAQSINWRIDRGDSGISAEILDFENNDPVSGIYTGRKFKLRGSCEEDGSDIIRYWHPSLDHLYEFRIECTR